MKRVGLVFALSGALVLAAAASAQAFIYWAAPGSMSEGTAIGRANNDGSGVDKQFISTGAVPSAVAVNSAHIYWANNGDNSIGRANLDGSGVDNSFITGVTQPTGVAVSSQYVFWSSLGNAIGRANLDGSNKNANLIPTATPCGVAVDSGHLYWGQDTGPPALIGRSDFNGSSVTQNFVTIGVAFPCGLAVNTANIFWADTGLFGGGSKIGRANTSTGMGVDTSTIGDASTPCGVALDTSHLYWANNGTTTIGRARTDSTDVNESFVHTGIAPCGVAVDSNGPPQTKIDSAKVRSRRRKATFRFSSSLSGSTFRCKLDRSAYRQCSSPKTYKHLKRGRHTFRVEAESSLRALDSTPAKKTFRVRR